MINTGEGSSYPPPLFADKALDEERRLDLLAREMILSGRFDSWSIAQGIMRRATPDLFSILRHLTQKQEVDE